MKTSIVLGQTINTRIALEIKRKRALFPADSESTAHLYHIENPEVDSYIIYSDRFSLNTIHTLIEHVHYLNSIITIVLCHSGNLERSDFKTEKNLVLIENEDELPSILNDIPDIQRNSNRTEWPVKVKYWKTSTPAEKHKANVLSISSGGCFIRTSEPTSMNESLLMLISFKEFDFYTEGTVVRTNRSGMFQPDGIAVQFRNTSPQTKHCIQQIIDERILSDLMSKLNPDSGKI